MCILLRWRKKFDNTMPVGKLTKNHCQKQKTKQIYYKYNMFICCIKSYVSDSTLRKISDNTKLFLKEGNLQILI